MEGSESANGGIQMETPTVHSWTYRCVCPGYCAAIPCPRCGPRSDPNQLPLGIEGALVYSTTVVATALDCLCPPPPGRSPLLHCPPAHPAPLPSTKRVEDHVRSVTNLRQNFSSSRMFSMSSEPRMRQFSAWGIRA